MPKEFAVGDTSYHFPDNYSDQQVQAILTKQGIIKPPESSPMAKAGHAFVEGLGIPAMLDIIGASNRHGTPQEIAARATKQKAALQGIVQGIVGEPGRVWDELSRTGESMLKGDLLGTAYHLAGAVPLIGAGAQQVAQDVQRGDPAAAVGHGAALVAPFFAGPAARAAGRGIATTGTAARGAVTGTVKAIPAAAAAAVEKSVYGALGGTEGMVGAGKIAAAKELGQGAITGARAALAERAAQTAARAAAPVPGSITPPAPPRSPLFPVPDITPPPAPRSPLFPDLPPRPRSPLFAVPDVPPESGPPAAAAEIAAQLEASMRAEALTDYVIRNKIPAAMLEEFGEKEWQMVADQAGVKAPTPENIQAIRGNLAEYEGASQITAKTPAEAAAEFEQKRAVRTRRKGPAAATEPAAAPAAPEPVELPPGQTPAQALAELMGPQPPLPPEGAAKLTASQVRVATFAEHLAADEGIRLEDLATVADNPAALKQMDELGRALGVNGALTAGDIPQIVDRVRRLRGGEAPQTTAGGEPPPGPPAGPQTLRTLMEGETAPGVTKPAATGTGSLQEKLQTLGDEAFDRVRNSGTFQGRTLPSLFPAEVTKDMVTWGAARIANGAIEFAQWSKAMLADAKAISPEARARVAGMLPDLWEKARKEYDHHVKTVGASLADLPTIMKYYRAGKEGKDWYSYVKPAMQPLFGKNTDLFLKMLAATSPNTKVTQNVTNAIKAYRQFAMGQPFEGFMQAHLDNLNRAVADVQMSGPKVSAFGPNLLGDLTPVTVDLWMARAILGRDTPTALQFKLVDYMTSQAAKKVGLEPAEMQAAIWTGIKKLTKSKDTAAPPEVIIQQYLDKNPAVRKLFEDALHMSEEHFQDLRSKQAPAKPPRV